MLRPPRNSSLDGQTAIVTGAGVGGIGEDIARAFCAEGAQVVVADLDGELAKATSEAIAAAGGRAASIQMDVREDAACESLVSFCEARFGVADILVNAAGVIAFERYGEATRAAMARQFDVNVFGLLMMSQIVSARMAAAGRKGSIVNIASIAGRRGQPDGPAYAASKAAVISLTQATALALAPHGIRANAIAPGFIRSKMWSAIERENQSSGLNVGDFRRGMEEAVPLGRLGDPSDLAGAAVFLCSPAGGYITGQTINIDGGFALN